MDTNLYCLCRQPDEGTPMICCDGCNDWYHFSCIGLKPKEGSEIDKYFCPICDPSGTKTIRKQKKQYESESDSESSSSGEDEKTSRKKTSKPSNQQQLKPKASILSSSQSQAANSQRTMLQKKLTEILQQGGGDATKSMKVSKEIESALFGLANSLGKEYREKFRSLAFNLPKNAQLRQQVLDGEISAKDLVSMSSNDVASADQVQARKQKEEEYRNSLIKQAEDDQAPPALVKPVTLLFQPHIVLDLTEQEKRQQERKLQEKLALEKIEQQTTMELKEEEIKELANKVSNAPIQEIAFPSFSEFSSQAKKRKVSTSDQDGVERTDSVEQLQGVEGNGNSNENESYNNNNNNNNNDNNNNNNGTDIVSSPEQDDLDDDPMNDSSKVDIENPFNKKKRKRDSSTNDSNNSNNNSVIGDWSWTGFLKTASQKLRVSARPVNLNDPPASKPSEKSITQVGRMDIPKLDQYLKQLGLSKSRRCVCVILDPEVESERLSYNASLEEYLKAGKAIVTKTPPFKEAFIFPLSKSHALSDWIGVSNLYRSGPVWIGAFVEERSKSSAPSKVLVNTGALAKSNSNNNIQVNNNNNNNNLLIPPSAASSLNPNLLNPIPNPNLLNPINTTNLLNPLANPLTNPLTNPLNPLANPLNPLANPLTNPLNTSTLVNPAFAGINLSALTSLSASIPRDPRDPRDPRLANMSNLAPTNNNNSFLNSLPSTTYIPNPTINQIPTTQPTQPTPSQSQPAPIPAGSDLLSALQQLTSMYGKKK